MNQRLQFQLLLCKGNAHYHISDKLPSLSVPLAEGETTHVTVNKSFHKVPLPDKYVAALEHFRANA